MADNEELERARREAEEARRNAEAAKAQRIWEARQREESAPNED